jgi:hypothetical protein
MTQPTYAVSSAPQGTFGASTPVVRSVAPAATETQRSGAFPSLPKYRRKVFPALALPLLLGDGFARSAETLGAKVTSAAETALVSTFTPSARLNSLKSFVPNSTEIALGSLTPEAKATGTGGVSTVVDQVLSNTPSAAADSCPATTQSGMISLLEDNLFTSIPKNHLKPAPLTYCFLDLKELDPEAADPFQSKLEERLVLLGSADGGGASGGSSDEPCRKAEGWIALTKSEVAKRAGSPLSPNAEEKAGAAGTYERLLRSDIVQWGKDLVCLILEPYLPEPSLKNIPEAVPGASKAYTRRGEELEKRSNDLFSF